MAKDEAAQKMKRKEYEKELRKLQVQLCYLQEWVKAEQLRVIVLFEGRDAAGKGGTIKALTEKVSPRVFRVAALPAPSDREKSQLFLQRYIAHFPAGGEIVIFDRSWYNRAGVEHVMGFCTPEQHKRFLELCPQVEKFAVDGGIILIKLWLEVGMEEQQRRFEARIEDPLRQWKLSPMDTESFGRWYDYSRARDMMFEATRAAEHHLAYPRYDPVQEGRAREGQAAKTIPQGPVRRSGQPAQAEIRRGAVLAADHCLVAPQSQPAFRSPSTLSILRVQLALSVLSAKPSACSTSRTCPRTPTM
jgi:polyphosphate kinase 2